MLEPVHSDDHGEYRVFSLTPGRYYVAARLEDLARRSVPLGFYPPGRMLASDRVESPVVMKRTLPTGEVVEETYPIVYFGGGTNPDLASPIDVGMGVSVSGVDISPATAKVPSRHIRGTILASANTAFPTGTRVIAIPQRYASGPGEAAGGNDIGFLASGFPEPELESHVKRNPSRNRRR